jgi:hypothetical protein
MRIGVPFRTRPHRHLRLRCFRAEAANGPPSMNALWIVLGFAVVGAVGRIVTWSRTGGRQSDLGSMSHHWVVEHRMSQSPDATGR